jgi:hypothetical protein
VRGVVAMAPHVFIEPICISSIEKASRVFEETDLKEKLGKYHRDVRKTFYGWADVWRDPDFLLKLEECGHAPFRDQPQAVLGAAEDFVKGLH